MAKKEKFSCPHCGLRYDARPEWAGQRAKCKCCKNVFTVPGTPDADQDPSGTQARAGDALSLPEAKIVDDPPSDKPVLEAEVIAGSQEGVFLEPINEPSADSPSLADDLFVGLGDLEEEATTGVIKPIQPPKPPSPKRSASKGRTGSSSNLLDKVLASLLLLMAGGVLLVVGIALFGAHTADQPTGGVFSAFLLLGLMCFLAMYCIFLAYLGFRHDRGAAWDDFLIRIWLVIAIVQVVISVVVFAIAFIVGLTSGKVGASGLMFLAGQLVGNFFINILFIYIWYLVLKKFGFFRPNAWGMILTPCLGFVAFMLLIGAMADAHQKQMANAPGASVEMPERAKMEESIKQVREKIRQESKGYHQQAEEMHRKSQEMRTGRVNASEPVVKTTPSVNDAPAAMPLPVGLGSNTPPFETPGMGGGRSQFGTDSDSAPPVNNPFEGPRPNGANENPFEVVATASRPSEVSPFRNISKDQLNAIVMKVMQSDAFQEKLQSDPMFPMKVHQLAQKLKKVDRQDIAPILMEEFPKLGLPLSLLAEFASEAATSGNNPFEMPSTPAPKESGNPFEASDATSSQSGNPFETTESDSGGNPFEAGDASSKESGNPFETSETASSQSGNPFETAETNSGNNPFEVVDEKPEAVKEKPVDASSVGAVSVDQILQRLNSGSTSGVKRILKSLSRCQPTEEKREAVCRTMISLLENDRLTFARREVVDILVDWMTPKVSDDLVRVMKASNDYASTEMIKQLARVQDDKVAAAVVELWAKKPLFLKEAVITLGTRAEVPLWEVLQSSDKKLQIAACHLLAQQGTQKSVMKLAELAYAKDKNRDVAQAAEDAMKSLNAK